MTFWRLEARSWKLERRCARLCGVDGGEVAKHVRRAQHAVTLPKQGHTDKSRPGWKARIEKPKLIHEAEGTDFGEESFVGNAEFFRGARFVPLGFAESVLNLKSLDMRDRPLRHLVQRPIP